MPIPRCIRHPYWPNVQSSSKPGFNRSCPTPSLTPTQCTHLECIMHPQQCRTTWPPHTASSLETLITILLWRVAVHEGDAAAQHIGQAGSLSQSWVVMQTEVLWRRNGHRSYKELAQVADTIWPRASHCRGTLSPVCVWGAAQPRSVAITRTQASWGKA